MKNSETATPFRNSTKRVIFRGKSGGYFVKKADGTKKYSPTASFRQVGNGPMTKVTTANTNVPSAIARKVRKNAGAKRGPRTPTEAALFRKIFASPKARTAAKKVAGPAKRPGRKPTTAAGMMKAGMTPNAGDLTRMLFKTPPKSKAGPRKVRKDAGAKRGTRTPTEAALFRKIFATPKARTAAKKAGPAKRPGRKPTTAAGMMKAGMSPNAGDLTRMLFKTVTKGRTAAKKVAGPRKSRVMKAPKATRPVLNLIVVSPGGTAKVQKVRKPRATKAATKAKVNKFNEGEMFRKIFATPKARKTRKNKGTKRGPRGVKGMRVNKNPFQALA